MDSITDYNNAKHVKSPSSIRRAASTNGGTDWHLSLGERAIAERLNRFCKVGESIMGLAATAYSVTGHRDSEWASTSSTPRILAQCPRSEWLGLTWGSELEGYGCVEKKCRQSRRR